MFISVLLPLPELPMIATKSPRSICSETSRSARTLIWPSSKIFETSCSSITGRRAARRAAPAGARGAARDQRPLRGVRAPALASAPARGRIIRRP